MSKHIVSDYRIVLEKKLAGLRFKLWRHGMNMRFLSFCSFIFLPIVAMMIRINPDIAIQFQSVMEEKTEFMRNLVDEYNSTVREYQSLFH